MKTTFMDPEPPPTPDSGVPTCYCGHVASVHDYADEGLWREGCAVCDCKRSRLMVRLIATSAAYRAFVESEDMRNPNWRADEERRISTTARRLRNAYDWRRPHDGPGGTHRDIT